MSLGVRGGHDYFLEAGVVNEEIVVNADLFDAVGKHVCVVRASFPEGEQCNKKLLPHCWTIFATDEELLGVQLTSEHVCLIRGRVYTRAGELVAEDTNDDFVVYRGPLVLGRSNGGSGIVVE